MEYHRSGTGKKSAKKQRKGLTKGRKAGILTERLAGGKKKAEKRSGSFRDFRKKFLTNLRVRGKLNKFASVDASGLKKDRKTSETGRKALKKLEKRSWQARAEVLK